MQKTLKINIILTISFLVFIFSLGTVVGAASIQSAETLQQCFEQKNVTIDGKTITLNGDVTFEEEGIEFSNGEYVLNLNGHKFMSDSIICTGKLTINDTTGGEISNDIITTTGGELLINNGNTKGTIFNEQDSKLTIEDGTFCSVNQFGETTINGGKFISEYPSLYIHAGFGKLVISKGEFTTTATDGEYGAISIEKPNSLSCEDINEHIADESMISYENFCFENTGYDEQTGCTYFYANYGPVVKVAKPTEYELNLIKKIAPDGKNAVLKTIKPKNEFESDFLMSNVVNNLLNEKDYSAHAYVDMDDMSKCTVWIEGDIFNKEYEINVTFDEPEQNAEVQSFISKMKEFNDVDIETYYQVKDLSLINYYMTSTKSELWNRGASARAFRYSEDIINMANGGNIKYYLDVKAGCQDESLMYEYAFGEMTVFYNNYAYTNKQQGIYFKRIIYIPEDTENTKQSYAFAAQKRINEYLGENLVDVRYGGQLESLDEECLDTSIPLEKTDGNYYNITVKGKTYKFYILKGTKEQLQEPVYKGTDYETNIQITSTDANVPLDTSISAIAVTSEQIKKALGTENYKAYDISLYSDGKAKFIEKLDNGNFKVSIPVLDGFEGKIITIYYVASDGEKKEYEATVENGYVYFETNHFSTYAITEKIKGEEKDETPKTGVENSILLLSTVLVTTATIVLTIKYKK